MCPDSNQTPTAHPSVLASICLQWKPTSLGMRTGVLSSISHSSSNDNMGPEWIPWAKPSREPL